MILPKGSDIAESSKIMLKKRQIFTGFTWMERTELTNRFEKSYDIF